MSAILLVTAALAVFHSNVNADSLTLTSVSQHVVLGQPFRFRCDMAGQWNSGIGGVVLFKLDGWAMCTVKRSTCSQFTVEDTGQFSCACADNTVDPVRYFLNISELKNDTLGPWLCEYQKQSNTIQLNPTDPVGPDSVTATPTSPVIVLEKQSLTLTCTADCIPDCVFMWTSLRNNTVIDITSSGGRSLVLRDVSPDMSGDYTCLAVNPASNTSSKVSFELVVNGAPRLKADSSFVGTIYTTLGQKETLTVPFLSPLAPTFTWGKVTGGKLSPVQSEAGRELSQKQSGDVYTAMLSLTVTESDLGVFCVTAGNQAGQESVYIQLRTQENVIAPCVAEATDQEHQTSLPPFNLGLVIGIGGTFLIAVVFGVIGYCKHRQVRRDLEHPYSVTDSFGIANLYQKAVESHYQELPTPIFDRKLENEGKNFKDADKSWIYNVFDDKDVGVDVPGRECCVSVVVGETLLNPVYNSLKPYPVTGIGSVGP